MPITPTNISKNTISPVGLSKASTLSATNTSKNSMSPTNQSRMGYFLLMEDGSYLLQESLFKIILESLFFSGTNTSKNAISPTNTTKN